MDELVGKKVKVSYSESLTTSHVKVIRGVLLAQDEYTVTIRGSEKGDIVVIGKPRIIAIMEIGGGGG